MWLRVIFGDRTQLRRLLEMDIPNSISISKRVRDQFQTIKNKTGLPNNVLSRIALTLAMESGAGVKQGSREDASGQTLPGTSLFGDYVGTL